MSGMVVQALNEIIIDNTEKLRKIESAIVIKFKSGENYKQELVQAKITKEVIVQATERLRLEQENIR